jgi:hypothetical protein
MLTVTIPVHPLSRAIILAEHGPEPVVLDSHDILFEIINTRITPDDLRNKSGLTEFIELTVNDRLAAHLAEYGLIAGLRLFRFHKYLMCRYADAQVRARGKGHGRPALQEFLNLYHIEEDAYGLETAYKLYQRFCWEIQKKNAGFFARMRRKPGVVLCEKNKMEKSSPSLPAELAVARFMSAVQIRMKRHHRSLEKQVRAYIYTHHFGLSVREAANKLCIPFGGAAYCARVMHRRISKNPTYARLLEESLALPETA